MKVNLIYRAPLMEEIASDPVEVICQSTNLPVIYEEQEEW